MAAKYIGPAWTDMQQVDGSIVLTKLHIYWNRGERQFALTEADARKSVAEINSQEK